MKGLSEYKKISIIGGADNPAREGLVCFEIEGMPSVELVEILNQAGIRTHLRKADHYSGNILSPLGMESCVRVSMCHYNTVAEVAAFLSVIQEVAA